MRLRFIVPTSILVLAGLGLGGAAPTSTAASEPVQEQVEVGLITIPVFVEDTRGQPVLDLTADDFTVTEDGKRMKIRNFSWIGATAPDAAGDRQSPRLHVVVFVDSQNIQPTHRQLILKRLGPLIDSEIAEDLPVMLAASAPNIEVLKAFSAPRAVLPYRLEELGQSASGGLFDATASRQQREQITRAVRELKDCIRAPSCDLRSMEGVVTRAVGEIRAYSSGVADQSRRTLDGFRHFTGSLNSFPGTKSVLYVSDGFPMQAGKDLFDELADAVRDAINRTDPGADRERSGSQDASNSYQRLQDIIQRAPMDFLSNDLARVIEQTTAAANANGVRIYALQASGLVELAAGGGDGQSALRTLSHSTGGDFLEGGVRAESMLKQILGDTGGYYSIAYAPPPAADQSYHSVDVKVRKHRSRARYPNGYVTRNEGSRRVDQVMAALFHGYGSNDAGIGIDLGAGPPDAGSTPTIQVKVRIPVRSLEFEVRGEQHVAEVKLVVAVMNAAGRTTMLREFPVTIAIPGQHIRDAREQDYPVSLSVPASQGANRIAVGLWDASSSRPALTSATYDWTE